MNLSEAILRLDLVYVSYILRTSYVDPRKTARMNIQNRSSGSLCEIEDVIVFDRMSLIA
jgi:hypothetical protein